MTAFRSACSKRFSAYSIECGEALATNASVALVQRGAPAFLARVDDESVSIISGPGSPKMFASCTCALFALGLDGCRHLWALVATLDDAGIVRAAMLQRGFDLVPRHPPSASFWIGARRLLGPARDPDDATRARVARGSGPRRSRSRS
jgi:hypothetical protein